MLHYRTTQRMPDQYRRWVNGLDRLPYIIDIITQPRSPHRLIARTAAVPAQTHGMSGVPMLCEVGQEVRVPAPCAMPRAVNEQQWRLMRRCLRLPCNNFEVHRGAPLMCDALL